MIFLKICLLQKNMDHICPTMQNAGIEKMERMFKNWESVNDEKEFDT